MKTIAGTGRRAEHGVDAIFVDRWSPRAMTGEALPREELLALLEAARWAPSSYNNQPWRFLYALRGGKGWDALLGLLNEGNRAWAEKAGALIVLCSKKTFDFNGKPSRTHRYDCGAAWGYFALQGSMRGLVVHGMEGFDYDRARGELRIPDDFEVEAMAAVGRPGDPAQLPDKLRAMERPSGRKRLSEIALEGGFPA